MKRRHANFDFDGVLILEMITYLVIIAALATMGYFVAFGTYHLFHSLELAPNEPATLFYVISLIGQCTFYLFAIWFTSLGIQISISLDAGETISYIVEAVVPLIEGLETILRRQW